ncbi:nucleotide exchange factor GrpE [Patescibacteria group bacterium]|nr:nucleotide exchange factor GrpE [Patescibacteria group bacterium]
MSGKEKNLEKEIKKLKEQLQEERERAEKHLKGWQRAKADYLNREKEIAKERESWIKFSNSKLILDLLNFLDSFRHCLDSVPENLKEEKWVQGVIQIKGQFENFLKNQGVEKIKTIGSSFDPDYHEAVDRIPSEDPQNIIVSEVQAGYQIGNHVIRAAKVIIK